MRFLISLALLAACAVPASAQDCHRQRQVLRVVQQPVYQLQLNQAVHDRQVLQIVEQQDYGSVLALESRPRYAVVVEQQRPQRLRLQLGSKLRLSNGRSLRVERRGLFGLRQRIVID